MHFKSLLLLSALWSLTAEAAPSPALTTSPTASTGHSSPSPLSFKTAFNNGTATSHATASPTITGSPLILHKGNDTFGNEKAVGPGGNEPVLFSASGTWLSVHCDNPALTDASTPAITQWAAAGASDAWKQLLDAWNGPQPSGNVHLAFAPYVYNQFHYQVDANCADVQNGVCDSTVQCGPTPPAGSLIINSLVGIHNIIKETNAAIAQVSSNMANTMTDFAAVFAKFPDQKGEMILKEILDALTFVIGIGSAFIWNDFIKTAGLFANDNYRGVWKDIANGAIAYGINSGKDSLSAPTNPYEESQTLSDILSRWTAGLEATQAGWLATTLAGNTSDSQSNMTAMLENGGILAAVQATNGDQWNDLQQAASAMLYGKMIPSAWKISQNKQRPFILRVDRSQYTCGSPISYDSTAKGLNLGNYMTNDVANKTHWCDPDGNTFFLLNAIDTVLDCNDNGCLPMGTMPFGALDGGTNDVLTGDPTVWGGITIGDIVQSSYAGFVVNGNKNNYTMPLDSNLITNPHFNITKGELPLQGSILTPGFFNLTICLSAELAGRGISSSSGSEPPCGNDVQTGPSVVVSPPTNSQGYAPGRCGLHVEQWQRNEGDENPTPDYQLAVTIKDGANIVIGSATKQIATHPLAVDSKLPFDVIVKEGNADNDPIQFWYADQYWDSNSKACSMGKYDSGNRNGDCSFNCPNPSGSAPPASATVALPTGIIPAANSQAALTTATGTASSSTAKPTETHAPGWCGVHVRQYQKNEKGENPSNDYAVEITLYDAKKNTVGTSGFQDAPANKPVPVTNSILPNPFTVTAQSVDSDPLLFAYGSTTWNSTGCKVGKYDSGHRDMDCGFTC